MAKRVRLTERRSKQAVDGSIPYPGNVNQPDRQFKRHDQYDNWEETINHPLPDMRHDWKNDERDEIGFGIPEPWGESPTVASVKVAANKAVKLAYLLLGNKVAENLIEDQASDFMLLGPEALDRSLARFAETGELYAEDEEAEAETKEASADEEEAEVTEAADKGKEEEEKAAETIQEEKEEEAKEASTEEAEAETKEASEELAEEGAEETVTEETGASEVEASESKEAADEEAETTEKEVEASEKVAEDDDDDDDDDDDSDEDDSKEASTAETMDIELTSAMDDGEVEVDSRLAGIFDDDIPAELPEPGANREASDKKGIKSLGGGQPKVASGDQGADIGSLWQDAPDVSDIFN